MKLTDFKNDTKHCIRTKKVFDWVNRIVQIKEKEVISFPSKMDKFKDCICCDFKIKCNSNTRTLLWKGYGIDHVTATIKIKLTSSCGCKLDIFVNGEKIDSICEGQSFCGTIGMVKYIEIQCTGKQHSDTCCCGELELNIHYTHEEESCNVDIKDAICFLSDENGNPLDPYDSESIKCEEQTEDYPREDVKITLRNGKKVTLQKITVLKSGFITVKFLNSINKVCMVCTFPFMEYETFHLCAPEGTELNCEITDFECKVKILPQLKDSNCVKIQIFIQICQSIQVIGNVKVEIMGIFCNPREEIEDITTCPPPEIPEDCPMVPS